MPSPVGHALGGVAAGFLVAGVPERGGYLDRRVATHTGALFAVVGATPDVDLLFGAHSGPTHGLGVALLAGVFAYAWRKRGGTRTSGGDNRRCPPFLWGAAVAAAYASHTLLDWLGHDTSAPIGIMALWPLTREYYESSLHVFMAVSRRYWLPGFWRHNVVAVLRELAILVPIVAIVAATRRGAVK